MADIADRLTRGSERASIVAACLTTCALASAHAIWKSAGHHLFAVDPVRLALCLLLIAVAYWAGFTGYKRVTILAWTRWNRGHPQLG